MDLGLLSEVETSAHAHRKLVPMIIIGLGQSGARFIRACLALNTSSIKITIVAAVDTDPAKRKQFQEKLGIPCYETVQAIAPTVQPRIAIITVSEHQHFRVLEDLKRYFPDLSRIMCEKPLAASAAEARRLLELFDQQKITVNFVERFSPVVASLQQFIKAHGRTVVRAYCSWGKYRVKDPRPTVGVVAVELGHPLDLVLMLAQVPPCTEHRVASLVATRSNFSVGGGAVQPLDTVYVALEFSTGLQLLATSSLLRSKRERRIELILTDHEGVASEMAVLEFDRPMWDLDRLDIYDMRGAGGHLKLIHTEQLKAGDWPADQLTIGKVCRFVAANLAELEGHVEEMLPRLDQCVHVQEVMESISAAAEVESLSLSCFVTTVDDSATVTESRIDFLARQAQGNMPTADEYIWDAPY